MENETKPKREFRGNQLIVMLSDEELQALKDAQCKTQLFIRSEAVRKAIATWCNQVLLAE